MKCVLTRFTKPVFYQTGMHDTRLNDALCVIRNYGLTEWLVGVRVLIALGIRGNGIYGVIMNTDTLLVVIAAGRYLCSTACFGGAIFLAYHKVDGWGWLVFAGIIFGAVGSS